MTRSEYVCTHMGRRFQGRVTVPDTADLIREDNDARPVMQLPERYLQVLWNEQRLRPGLELVTGEPLRVVSPGTWNDGGGPDFRAAVVFIDGVRHAGDVEVHRRASDWRAHGHDRDPAYRGVVLHVVADVPPRPPGGPPCLSLANQLDEGFARLLADLEAASYPYGRRVPPGDCAIRWALTDDTTVNGLLTAAGLARFGSKAVLIQRAALATGWDQAIYVQVFDALGYRANREAFRELAASTPLSDLRAGGSAEARLAVLFGRASLLPDPSVDPVAPAYLGRLGHLWDLWWSSGTEPLKLAWQWGACRPQNTPERRLIGGAEFLERCRLQPLQWLLDTMARVSEPGRFHRVLASSLSRPTFWDRLSTFRVSLPRPARLLGTTRTRDTIVNVFLPALLGYGRQTGDSRIAEYARTAYLAVPRLQGNRLLTEAVHRFLVPPSRGAALLRSACAQQGLLELYRSLCLALHTDCRNCPMVAAPPPLREGQ